MMKSILKDNNVDIKAMTGKSETDPVGISRAWKEWSSDPANKEAFLK